ncbi:MAG: class I SAM-dependent methyltransferase [Steroidobacteraceae bacterium]
MPAVLAAHYEKYYLTRREESTALERLVTLHEPIARWLLDSLPGPDQKKIFDYGFGSGAFLIQVMRQGHTACGADLSRQNVRQLAEYCVRNGLAATMVDLSCSPLEAMRQDRFDVITLFQVIEHLSEPLAEVVRLSQFQLPGGLIYIECPNQAAVLAWAKRFTRFPTTRRLFWGSMKYPEHLHGFNRRSLRRLLETAGYEVESCGDYHYGDRLHQVEAEAWWPGFRDNPNLWTPYGFSRSLIPLADSLMSRLFGAGSGLFALARKLA